MILAFIVGEVSYSSASDKICHEFDLIIFSYRHSIQTCIIGI